MNALVLAVVVLLGGSAEKAAEFHVVVQPQCADVWQTVFEGLDAYEDTDVTIAEPRKEDLKLPRPDVRRTFFSSVSTLSDAIADLDDLDRDLLYIRIQTERLEVLEKKYPKIDAGTLRSAKVRACQDTLAE